MCLNKPDKRKFSRARLIKRTKKIMIVLPKSIASIVSKRIKKPSTALIVRTVQYRQSFFKRLLSSSYYRDSYKWCEAKPFMAFVWLPWLVCAFYLIFIKSPIFESSSRFLVEKNGKDSSLMVNLGFLGQSGGAGGGSKTTILIQEYITSRDMLDYLNEKLNFKQHYQSSEVDYLSRLSSKAKDKKSLEYFQKQVHVNFNDNTQELEVIAQAFSAEFVYKLLNEIIDNARIFAKGLSNTLTAEQLKFAAKQLKATKVKFHKAEQKILAFQNANGMLDPKESIVVVSKIIASLEAKLVEKQTEVIAYKSYLAPNSTKIVALNNEISAIKQQIKNQSVRLLGDANKPLNSTFAKFQWLNLDLKFATAEYEASQNAYEAARLELSKQQELVVEVSPARLPDDYAYPESFFSLICIFIGLSMAYGIARMTYIIVQDHID